ncbi:uncharacterized protein [Nicotiana tomentosiformis]|uniref:uncharacterized protein n=1 Tax=Nicotiana tomentosiformis TaxID=4098 RepID=UPI00388C98F6
MPFPEKWNMKLVARMPDVVPQVKEWVKDLVSQRPYSERAGMELSKGRWESRNHSLPKDIAMRPPSGDEDVPLESPAMRQGDEKKRKRAQCSLDSEKEKPKRRLVRKPKKSTGILSSDSIRQLRDGSEEEEEDNSELVARVRTALPQDGEASKKALAEASVLYHETFLQFWEELTQHEAEVRELTEKRDSYKLLSEKLSAESETAREEHAEWAEQVKKIEELQSHLNSAISGQENLAKELEAAKSEVVVAETKADAKVAQFKVDVEAIHVQAKSMVEHARWKARREAFEGVHAQSFDLLAEIENAKVEEARAWKLAFPEEDSESLTESEGEEDPEDEDDAPDEDQAA